MKTKLQVQFDGNDVLTTDVEKVVKAELKAKGIKTTDVDTLDVYFQPDTNAIYYVATKKDGSTEGNEEALYLG